MRIIAGKYRSRILKSLKGLALRPTSDRLRETLFNVLGPGVVGSRFLDVFAGTGAVGIEALSRSAADVTFIENHAPAAKLIRQNLDSLKITSGYTILTADAHTALQKLAARHTPSSSGFRLRLRRSPLRRPRRLRPHPRVSRDRKFSRPRRLHHLRASPQISAPRTIRPPPPHPRPETR